MDSWDEPRARLVQRLLAKGVLKPGRVAEAMRRVPRHLFLQGHEREAYDDAPQGIGQGQTISAPHMVALMAEALGAEPGETVLEVGTGSGYHAAIVAELLRPHGHVVSVERFPDLAAQARANLEHAGYSHDHVEVVIADGSGGWEKSAPYDAIYVTCAAPKVPEPLLAQLKPGGRLLVPVGDLRTQELLRVTKDKDGRVASENLGACVFVPLVGEHGFAETRWN